MTQQTHSVQDNANTVFYQTNANHGSSLVKILRSCFSVIRKIAGTALNIFHLFVAHAEQPNLPNNTYWWDSPDSVKKVIKS